MNSTSDVSSAESACSLLLFAPPRCAEGGLRVLAFPALLVDAAAPACPGCRDEPRPPREARLAAPRTLEGGGRADAKADATPTPRRRHAGATPTTISS